MNKISMTNHYDDKGAFVRLEIDGKWIADFNKREYVNEYLEYRDLIDKTKIGLDRVLSLPIEGCYACDEIYTEVSKLLDLLERK